ncbi:DgyrCDS8752 [Dimorphilus gyrociliatus]|nr:DgyrCDS8752 [Dimorphilus gyrociliatus]
MPNTPCLVQSGVCVFTRGKHANESDADLVTEMLNCVGLVEEMPETLMDTVTGLSGSGPAYAFVTIEALADGGVKMGLNREQALRLSAQTLMGAAKLVLESGKHPEVLKDDVCSPGGTSIHALHQLEKGQYRATLMNAVEAGTLRSKELGEPI